MKKVINTYLPLPFKISKKGLFFGKKIHRVNGKIWSDESVHKADWFTQIDSVAKVLLGQVTKYAAKDECILDVCCNIGRHLNYLNNRGYSSLHGFDIMRPAIEKMGNIFPNIDMKNIKLGNLVDILPMYAENSFDWAYTHSATVELIHPSFRMHNEMARVVRKGVIFLINEINQGYVRDYEYLYNGAGFVTAKKMLVGSKSYNFTLYVWIKKDYLSEYIRPEFIVD